MPYESSLPRAHSTGGEPSQSPSLSPAAKSTTYRHSSSHGGPGGAAATPGAEGGGGAHGASACTTSTHRYGPVALLRWQAAISPRPFEPAQHEEAAARNFTAPRQSVWITGEEVDVTPASFDAAVLTHVLRSVSDPVAVLRQAARALRPGGRVFVLEHVTVQYDSTSPEVRGEAHLDVK